jgi:lipopolysaccharide cholinephosphotransferase
MQKRKIWKILGKIFLWLFLLGAISLGVFKKLRHLVLSNITLVRFLSTYTPYASYVTPKPLRPEYGVALYQLMKDIHDVLEVCHIPYWIEAGTLLGAVRHGGIIPWDDDIDTQIHEKDCSVFVKKAIPLFKALGYGVSYFSKHGGVRVWMSPKKITLLQDEVLPGADIFYAKEKKPGELFIWGCKKSLKLAALLPLKRYAFGALWVWGPANPIPYLEELYGKNWNTMAKRGNDHSTIHKRSQHETFILEDFSPLRPFGPLEDHRIWLEKKSRTQP